MAKVICYYTVFKNWFMSSYVQTVYYIILNGFVPFFVKSWSIQMSWSLTTWSIILFLVSNLWSLHWFECCLKYLARKLIGKRTPETVYALSYAKNPWSTHIFSFSTHNLDKLCVRFILGVKP